MIWRRRWRRLGLARWDNSSMAEEIIYPKSRLDRDRCKACVCGIVCEVSDMFGDPPIWCGPCMEGLLRKIGRLGGRRAAGQVLRVRALLVAHMGHRGSRPVPRVSASPQEVASDTDDLQVLRRSIPADRKLLIVLWRHRACAQHGGCSPAWDAYQRRVGSDHKAMGRCVRLLRSEQRLADQGSCEAGEQGRL